MAQEQGHEVAAQRICREVVFTDYDHDEGVRPAVTLSPVPGEAVPAALVQIGGEHLAAELKDPRQVRSLATCLLAAADEMERRGA